MDEIIKVPPEIIIVNSKATAHFDYTDFACKCCGKLILSDLFYRHICLLEIARLRLNEPVIVNCGYRCEKHNKEVGGVESSMHLLFATDTRPVLDRHLDDWFHICESVGFTGIGYYDTFCHTDCRPIPARWDYRKKTA